jgi:hypothetical protein
MTLGPGRSLEVRLTVLSDQATTYHLAPILMVRTATGTVAVPVPQSATTLAFAQASQFTCYRRQDHAYVPAAVGPPVLAGPIGLWCI